VRCASLLYRSAQLSKEKHKAGEKCKPPKLSKLRGDEDITRRHPYLSAVALDAAQLRTPQRSPQRSLPPRRPGVDERSVTWRFGTLQGKRY